TVNICARKALKPPAHAIILSVRQSPIYLDSMPAGIIPVTQLPKHTRSENSGTRRLEEKKIYESAIGVSRRVPDSNGCDCRLGLRGGECQPSRDCHHLPFRLVEIHRFRPVVLL